MKIAILGCGVAGLSAAHELRRSGIEVKLFDKSRGVGGRMSTRYAGQWEFDHGAQFFTVQDPDFKAVIDVAITANVVAPWRAMALYLKTGELSADKGRDRYVGTPRMNSLPKYWAKDFDIDLGRRATAVKKAESWQITFEDGGVETGFDGVISTLPPKQAEDVLPQSFRHMPAIQSAKMQACFCLMIGLASSITPGWETLRVKDLPIDWISMNHAKPSRAQDVGTIIVHAEAGWSDAHADADRDWVQDVMLNAASALLGISLETAPHIALHRWLYASSKTSPEIACLSDGGLAAAGDWCLGGRVQGAWLSGRAAARVFTSS